MKRLFAALYVSDRLHCEWQIGGKLHHKARAVVRFDRVLTGGNHCLSLNGLPLESILAESSKPEQVPA